MTALVDLAHRLNGPEGCPWDRAQTFDSLLPHLVEEVWELYAAAKVGDPRHVEEEFGDVLYTILFLGIVAEREQRLRFGRALAGTHRKLVRRHPHVFRSAKARSVEEAYAAWQQAKRREPQKHSHSKQMRPLLIRLWEIIDWDANAAARAQSLMNGIATERPSTNDTATRSRDR